MISTAVLLVVVWTGHATQQHTMPDLGACLRARTEIDAAARDQFGVVAEKTIHAFCTAPAYPEIVS
ncbi:MAG TPA: hypothetical protein VKI44_35140 [Acetobacteraceae bacterium]|nr:hypothetical protein [Acetobacteraceae bacterium]